MLSNLRRWVVAVPATALSLAFSASAVADIPPPNECSNMMSAGSACTTAGPSYNEDGVCTKTTCLVGAPPKSPTACVLCLLPDAGSAVEGADAAVVDATIDTGAGPVADASAVVDDSGPIVADSGAAVVVDSGQALVDAASPTQSDASSNRTGGSSEALQSSGGCAVGIRGGIGAAASSLSLVAIVGLGISLGRRRRS